MKPAAFSHLDLDDNQRIYKYLIGNLEMKKQEEAIHKVRNKGVFLRSDLLWRNCRD
jgi:hypothetical protein